MHAKIQRITTLFWFDNQAQEAVGFYTTVFANLRIVTSTHYSKESAQAFGQSEGSVMTIGFQLDGQDFTGFGG